MSAECVYCGRPHPDDFSSFMCALQSSSDRGGAVYGVAQLHVLLKQIITNFLPHGCKTDFLKRQTSNISASILFCSSMGLIDAQFESTLNGINKIRNGFAHDPNQNDLDSCDNQIRELVKPFAAVEEFAELKAQYIEKTSAAADFYAILGIMALRLESLLSNIRRLDRSQEMPLIPPHFLE